MPIRWRLTLFGAGVITAAVTVLTVLIYALAVRGVTRDQDRALRARADEALASLQQAGAEAFNPSPWPAAVNLATSLEVFVLVLGPDGAPLTGTAHLDGAALPIPPDLLARSAASGNVTATYAPRAGLPTRIHIRPWERPDLGRSGFLVTGQAARAARQDIRGLRAFLIVSAVVTLIGAMAAGWLATGRALRPLKSVAAATEQIGRTGDLSSRLPHVHTKDEVGRLAESFNGMLARVEDAYRKLAESLEAQKRFVADASHELRTPLTTIRGNAGFLLGRAEVSEADRRSALEDIAVESERMSRIVQDLLTLAHADAGVHLDLSGVDLTAIVEDVGRRARRLYTDRRLLVEEATTEATVRGNADALSQLLWILIDNAVKHTPEHGEIRLRLAARGGRAYVTVADTGCGIPETDLARIFDRFYQADSARSSGGAGLGLAIARWIVDEHGGRVTAHNNPRGGATFRVELPLA